MKKHDEKIPVTNISNSFWKIMYQLNSPAFTTQNKQKILVVKQILIATKIGKLERPSNLKNEWSNVLSNTEGDWKTKLQIDEIILNADCGTDS